MEQQSKKKSYRHLFFFSILIGAGLGVLVWQFYKYQLANKSVHKLVSDKSNGLYLIKYKNLRFDEVAGNLHVEHIELTPDPSVYHQMIKDKISPDLLFKVTIPSLKILHVRTPKALLKKETIDVTELKMTREIPKEFYTANNIK